MEKFVVSRVPNALLIFFTKYQIMSEIENFIHTWEGLTLSLSDTLKETDLYKAFIEWRTKNQQNRNEYALLKENISHYDNDFREYERYERLCNDSPTDKPIHQYKYYKDEIEKVKINDIRERFRQIKDEFLTFTVPFQLKLVKWLGKTLELTEMLIVSEEHEFLEFLVKHFTTCLYNEVKVKLQNDSNLLVIIKKITECRNSIDNEYRYSYPNEGFVSIEEKIAKLRRSKVKYSQNEYEEYVRKVFIY